MIKFLLDNSIGVSIPCNPISSCFETDYLLLFNNNDISSLKTVDANPKDSM